ncbi:MAG TPA: YihY/virulence factor BrkB family protein [Anditalea sp.]|nr:YihY/virulence factor BrkB family protein [Anditalea sp.]
MSVDKGLHAKKPTNIPWSGWKEILVRVKDKMDIKNIPVMAAGVAFYFFLSLFPAMLAIVTLYTLITDPLLVREHLEKLSQIMPPGVHEFLSDKIMNIADATDNSKNIGLALSFILGLGSANKGTLYLFRAINEIYDEENKRNFIKQNVITIGFTLGLIIIGILSILMIVAYPIINQFLDINGLFERIVTFSRWIILAIIFLFCIGLIYQFAPQRSHPRFNWVSPGAILATVLWLLGSLILTIYVLNFDKMEELYGQISALIVLMIWLNVTSFVILLGAQVNAEMEHQTDQDTTQGKRKPMGERHAHYADHAAHDEIKK